jgi:hypothetical protein
MGNVLAPPELVELGLMEKFHWTPEQIDRIPFGRLQKIFLVMNQKEQSQVSANEMKAHMAGARKTSKKSSRK